MMAITDNARYHHAKALRPWLKQHRDSFRLEFLPPYSPELNPIERVWKLVRYRAVHNCYFDTLQALIDAVSEQLILFAKPNEILERLCCIT